MAPEGTKKLLQDLRSKQPEADAEKSDPAVLCEHLQAEMQEFYNELAEKNGTAAEKKEA